MSKKSQDFIKEHISGLKKEISSDRARNALKCNLLIRTHQKNRDKRKIQNLIAGLKQRRNELFPYLTKIKKNVPDILEETFEVYVLLN